ncbi:MAG: hypothetical protein OXI24_05335, partial [Candidatus Poribacteria bacterium]|nr:hypothetical protein [Candidatus Poribacteria bacterium]
KSGVTWVCRVTMKGLFFWCYYESAFFVSQRYPCKATCGVGLEGFLLLGLLKGYYENGVHLCENDREYSFNLTIYFC